MDKVFVMQFYSYDTYSYDGLSESDIKIFSTEEKANQWAEDNGYSVVNWADTNKQVTVTPEEVI